MNRGNTADLLTAARLLLAPWLLVIEPFTPLFCAVYLLCGLTDVLDGAVARRTGTVTRRGAVLDSAADAVFAAVCLPRILPRLSASLWLWCWGGAILLLRLWNLGWGWHRYHRPVLLHTAANKVTGGVLFLLTLLVGRVPTVWLLTPACAIATFAALQEGKRLHTGREEP